jgi:hypothetical protein
MIFKLIILIYYYYFIYDYKFNLHHYAKFGSINRRSDRHYICMIIIELLKVSHKLVSAWNLWLCHNRKC